MIRRAQNVHFVGIGGAGMSGLAEILQASGHRVSGSDVNESETLDRLRRLGVSVSVGHDAGAIAGTDVVVYSSAIPATNPELRAAEAARIPVIPRAEMLAELMRMKYGIAIAGSHGKTTTASLTSAVLQAGGLDPTTIVGGRVHNLGTNSRLGSGDVLVAEADESDGSFLRLLPTIVTITNIDREHLDHYGDFEALRRAFLDFANRVPFYGANVLCLDDPQVQLLLPDVARRKITYGLSTQAEVSADEIAMEGLESRFRARAFGRPLGEFRMRLHGLHNVRNALAAIAVGIEFEVAPARIAEALAEFRGVARRFEVRGDEGGVLVVDDYAHHPTEIRTTLGAARDAMRRRLVVAFQPHRYTRTLDLFDVYAGAFHDAHTLILTEIYAAGEDKIPGIDGAALAESVAGSGHRRALFVPEREAVVDALLGRVRPGDVVIFMGAGDLGRLADPLLAALRERTSSSRGGSDD